MLTFQMKVSQVLQGDFQFQRLNLLLAFQVNCPGCFILALPLAARLHDVYGDRVNILGLSTAFEDFDLNTLENTRRLLATGEVVGATKRYLQRQDLVSYGVPIRFPVAFDWVESNPIGCQTPRAVAPAYTFQANHLQGTPSWILFDQSSRILARWFGHKSESEVELILYRTLSGKLRS